MTLCPALYNGSTGYALIVLSNSCQYPPWMYTKIGASGTHMFTLQTIQMNKQKKNVDNGEKCKNKLSQEHVDNGHNCWKSISDCRMHSVLEVFYTFSRIHLIHTFLIAHKRIDI